MHWTVSFFGYLDRDLRLSRESLRVKVSVVDTTDFIDRYNRRTYLRPYSR